MKKQNDVFSELIVGVFMIVVVALLGYFTIVISGADLFGGKARVRVRAEFADVAGLKERDNVVYRGMKVGTVEKIRLGAGVTTVYLSVDHDVVLRTDCLVTVKPLSLLGGNCLLLEEGTGAVQPLETTLFKGTPPTDWMRDLGEIARRLNKATDNGGIETIVSNFEAMSAQVRELSERVSRGEGTLGKLLSTNDAVYADIAETASSAKKVATRLERGEGALGKLLSADEAPYRDLKTMLTNAADLSERLAKGEGTMGHLFSKDDALYGDLKAAVSDLRASLADVKAVAARVASGEGLLGRATQDKALGDDAARLIANLKDVSERLAKGEGTLGKLTTDPELYDEINGLLKDVRQVVDNYRDTTPISSFAGLVGGAL